MAAVAPGGGARVKAVLETSGGKRRGVRPPWLAFLVGGLILVGVLAVVRGGAGFEPGELLSGAGVEDIVVSGEDSLYPPPDVDIFSVSPDTLHVYLVVDGLAAEELNASVERADRATVVSWLFAAPQKLRVTDEGEERLVQDGGEVSGLIRFSIRPDDGEPVAPGDYTVSVRAAGDENPLATKSFVVAE